MTTTQEYLTTELRKYDSEAIVIINHHDDTITATLWHTLWTCHHTAEIRFYRFVSERSPLNAITVPVETTVDSKRHSDENGMEVDYSLWTSVCSTDMLDSCGERVTIARALEIATDMLIYHMRNMPVLEGVDPAWTPHDVKLALANITALRLQRGENFDPAADGWLTSHCDVCIYG